MAKRRRPTEATLLQTLVFFDEPQLILLRTEGTGLIVAIAVEDPEYDNPYYGAEITRDQFIDFLMEKFDLRYLFERPKFRTWYMIDLDEVENERAPIYRRQLNEDLQAFLPNHGLFARELTEPVEELSFAEQVTETFSIDGSWDLPEFSQFYGQFTDLYLVFNSVDVFLDGQATLDERRRVQEAFIRPWEGGGSYGGFYDSLLDVQKREERLRVGAIQYASPGFVDVRGREKPFREVRELVSRFSEHHEAMAEGYTSLRKFLSEMKLLRLPADKFDRQSELAKDVDERARKYAEVLGAIPYPTIFHMAGRDPLIAAKVLLSVYRRLSRLYEFFVQGRVSFSEEAETAGAT